MATKEAAQEAIKDPNPVVDGRKANVNLAYLGAKPRTALNNASASNLSFYYFKSHLIDFAVRI